MIRVAMVLALAACSSATSRQAPPPAPSASVTTPPPRAVDVVETIELGGLPQRVLIRGREAHLPVLLFVHAPGDPESQRAHVYGRSLEEDWLVVHWDQRGTPASPADPPTAGQLLQDLLSLMEHLEARFSAPGVTLVGHDFGAALAIRAAAARPDLVRAVVGLGTLIDGHRSEALSYAYALERARADDELKAVRELERIGSPPWRSPQARETARRWLIRLGGTLRGERSLDALRMLDRHAPADYAVDHAALTAARERTVAALTPHVIAVSLPAEIPELQVPLFLVTGRLDYTTPFELAERWLIDLSAPRGKRLVWFDEAAHWPHVEEPTTFAELLRGPVLEAARRPRE